MYLLALLATNAGLAYGGAPYLASLFGFDAGPASNAVGALAMIIAAAFINFAGTKILAKGVEAGVWAGLIGLAFAGVYLLLFGRVQPVSVLFDNLGAGAGNYTSALFAASLIGIWIIFGFEACGDLGEEVQEATHKVPRAMMLTMWVGGASTLIIALTIPLSILASILILQAMGQTLNLMTLCDLFTLKKKNKHLKNLKIAISGDLKGSRTIHSFVYALARFGANIMPMPAKGMGLPAHVDRRLREK
jgi:amino acid transporter